MGAFSAEHGVVLLILELKQVTTLYVHFHSNNSEKKAESKEDVLMSVVIETEIKQLEAGKMYLSRAFRVIDP